LRPYTYKNNKNAIICDSANICTVTLPFFKSDIHSIDTPIDIDAKMTYTIKSNPYTFGMFGNNKDAHDVIHAAA
jgi:hypothetical protein